MTPTTFKASHEQDDIRPFAVSNDLLDDPPRLRAQMREDGYVFLRGVANKEKILTLRRDILALCRDAGWVEPSSDGLEAMWTGIEPVTEGEPAYFEVYKKIVYLPSFIALPEDEGMTRIMSKIVDGPVLAHRLRIGRITFPNNVKQTTGAHQDFHYIAGTPDTYTVWMPLGDCPVQLGGLALLRGSHRAGFIEHVVKDGAKYAAAGVPDDRMPSGAGVEWHGGDFALGDAVIFHSHTIHKALPNLTRDQLRLSCDNRYQREGDAIADHSMKKHYGL